MRTVGGFGSTVIAVDFCRTRKVFWTPEIGNPYLVSEHTTSVSSVNAVRVSCSIIYLWIKAVTATGRIGHLLTLKLLASAAQVGHVQWSTPGRDDSNVSSGVRHCDSST